MSNKYLMMQNSRIQKEKEEHVIFRVKFSIKNGSSFPSNSIRNLEMANNKDCLTLSSQ